MHFTQSNITIQGRLKQIQDVYYNPQRSYCKDKTRRCGQKANRGDKMETKQKSNNNNNKKVRKDQGAQNRQDQ